MAEDVGVGHWVENKMRWLGMSPAKAGHATWHEAGVEPGDGQGLMR